MFGRGLRATPRTSFRPYRRNSNYSAPPSGGGSYDAYFTDVLQQVSGGPVRTYGWLASDYSITLLDTHTHDGNSWAVDGQTMSVTTKTGRLVTISGANQAARDTALDAAIADVQPGDTIQLRAGTYNSTYGPNAGYNSSQVILFNTETGTESQPVHFTAYPSEAVSFTNSSGGNFFCGHYSSADHCDYWTVSAISFTGLEDNFYSGAQTGNESDPESGGRFWRLVGCAFHRTDNVNNVGQVEYGGDNLQVFGCTFTNIIDANPPENQAHAIYIDCGADNCEIAYNRFENRREGFILMIHQDGAGMVYTGNWVHHNYWQSNGGNTARGFSQSNVDNTSTATVEDNYFDQVGDDSGGFGPLEVYRGSVTAKRNTFNNCRGPAAMVTDNLFGGTRHLYYGSGADANVIVGGQTTFSGSAGDRSAV